MEYSLVAMEKDRRA